MTDLARLGMVFDVQGADKANKALDDVAAKSGKAEAATTSLAQAQQKASGASSELSASADKVAQDMANVARAQQDAAKAAGAMASAQQSAASSVRDAAASNDNLTKSVAGASTAARDHASAIGDVITATGNADRSGKGWIGTLGSLLGAFTGLSVATAILGAITGAMEESKRATEEAEKLQLQYNGAMAAAEDVINGVTIATYKLADARAEAARQSLNEARAANNAEAAKIKNPGFLTSVGQNLLNGPSFQANKQQAQLEEIAKRNAALMQEEIALTLKSSSAHNAYTAAIDKALPKEKALADIKSRRATVELGLKNGAIDAATGQKALNALDAEAIKLTTDHTRVKVAHTRAVREHVAALTEEQKAAKALQDYSDKQDKELSTFGLTPSDAKQMAALDKASQALALGLTGLAAHIAGTAQRMADLEKITQANADGNVTFVRTVDDLQKSFEDGQASAKSWGDKVQDAADQARDFAFAVQDVAGALKSGDWTSALAGIGKLAQGLRDAFKTGSTADKVSAVGGIAQGIGGAIGGKAGGFISGAAGGAMTGFTLGGPIGAVAGGLIGGITSLFGGNKQARAERRAKEQQAAQEAADRAQQIATQRRELEVQLIELSGDKIKSLAAQRDAELSSIDASNVALQKQVYEAQDRENRRQEVQSAEITYLQLAGKNLDALNVQREEEIKNIDAAVQPLQRLVYAAQDAADALAAAGDTLDKAKSDLASAASTELERLQGNVTTAHDALAAAYDKESSALTDVITKNRQAAQSLRDYAKSLDADTSGLSPENAYRKAKATFEDVSRRAQLGDAQAQQDFAGAGDAFKTASQQYNGISPAYLQDVAGIRAATDAAAATADRTANNAESQLEALKQLVSGYLDLTDKTVSIDQGIKDLVTAQDALKHTQSIVEPLLGINNGVMNLSLAIMNYQLAMVQYAEAQAANAAAIQSLATAVATAKADPNNQNQPAPDSVQTTQGYRSTNGDYAAFVDGNADLLAAYNSGKGMAKGRTKAEFGLYYWGNFGIQETAEGRGRAVRPYAHGGEFMVGGTGGTDSQHVEFMGSPDEHVTVKTPQQMAREAAALERLAAAQEETNANLKALIYEAKAGVKAQIIGHEVIKESNAALGESIEISKRRSAA